MSQRWDSKATVEAVEAAAPAPLAGPNPPGGGPRGQALCLYEVGMVFATYFFFKEVAGRGFWKKVCLISSEKRRSVDE